MYLLFQTEGGNFTILIAFVVAALALIIVFFSLLKRYKRCPSDRILVIYGKTGKGQSAKCIHGGASFVWPVIQDYAFLDLTPMSIEVNLANALSRQNIRVNVPSRFTIGVSTDPGVMQNAAERLLGLGLSDIQELAKEIIFGQLRLVVASMDIEEINSDRDKFLQNITENLENELRKVGLKLINVNITDIEDESGYIEALGKEAAAHAINAAKKSVAEKNRDGAIGEANAKQDERIQVAAANAKAIEGENNSLVDVANSNAFRREKEAEAERIAIAAEKIQTAKALEQAYVAEQAAENQRAERDKATQYADFVVPAEIEKSKIEIDAEAEAEKTRRIAKGEADGVLYMKQAEGQGLYEVLTKQAQGLEQVVKAAEGDSKNAVLLLIADKLPELVKMQSEAIKNIKIDKVTVWDGNSNKSENGKTSTANFLSGIYKSVPPLEDLFNMAGMELPGYLRSKKEGQQEELPTKDTEILNPKDKK